MTYVGISWCLARSLRHLRMNLKQMKEHDLSLTEMCQRVDFQALERQVWVDCSAEIESIGFLLVCFVLFF